MAKVALLIGVSEYQPGLNPLPGSVLDVDALREVLVHPEMGDFAETDVITLKNPQRQEMEDQVYRLFANRSKDDLLLFYFSGHGVRDERGQLYLANCNTRKDNGQLVDSTAVAATYLQNKINSSKSQRQVIILDCCFSGAIAQGMTIKDDGVVDVNAYLGGKGRAILTSSTATEYSYGSDSSEETGLSVYTRYLIEGIKTGAADTDNDGNIGVDELHEYAARCVKEAAPAMTPKFYPVEEGYKIILAKSPKDDPVLKYRKEVHRKVEQGQGRLSSFAERMLINKQNEWGISAEIAKQIRDEVLQPYREYEQALRESVKAGEIQYPFSPSIEADLQEYRQYLKLKESDIIAIEAKILLPLKIEYEESLKKVNTIVSEPELKSNLITEDLGNNVKLEMVTIPAGSFTMGSDESDYDDEKPQHQVKLQEFYLGKYPVTQEQYQAIMGNNPSKFKDNPKNPVELVSWDDAQEFCQKLNQKTGKKYRLPTEAEWEYACRAGTQTRYYFGDDEKQLGEYAWFDKNSDSKTHPVGQKKPNNWGLHDMSGNVWEWCEDPWHDSYANKPEDIKNNGNSIWSDSNESRHILRGGSWGSDSGDCRSALRLGYGADGRGNGLGFRLVLCSF